METTATQIKTLSELYFLMKLLQRRCPAVMLARMLKYDEHEKFDD